MKIKIEKPKENIWKFPCLGQLSSGTKVYFCEWETGVVVESNDEYKIGYISAIWDMDKFIQIDINGNKLNTNPEPIDWDKVEFPIWVEDKDGIITQIVHIYETEIREFIIPIDGKISYNARLFITPQQKIEYLNSLKLAPKGTKITFEL